MNLVERLIHQRFNVLGSTMFHASHTEEARWWLNAIADEIEHHENTFKGVMRALGVETEDRGVAIWLRAQAKEEE